MLDHRPAGSAATEAVIAIETELKLAAAAEDLPRLKAALVAIGTNSAEAPLVSTYFDTEDFALQRKGLTLRVRKRGRQLIQTVKTGDMAEAASWGRGEWEDPIAQQRPDPAAPSSGRHLPRNIKSGDLQPIFTTSVNRTTVTLAPRGETRIEAAIDQGEIHSGDGAGEAISEIELELKSGDPAALYDIALRLLDIAPLRVSIDSKSARGYRLARNGKPPIEAVHAKPVSLKPGMTVDEALQRIGRSCFAHLLRNEPAALAREAEGVHQMRVAIRRLRSALSAFRPMLSAEHYRWASGELRWMAGALGAARNWDVFATALLAPVGAALPYDRDLHHLTAAKEDQIRASYDAAIAAIASKRYTASLLRLSRWFEARGWRDQPVSEGSARLLSPIGALAPGLLDKRLRRVRKRGKRFAKLTPEQRHRLRIALKKLRYTIELLGSLFHDRAMRRYIRQLKPLQDELGEANDVRVAHALVAELRDAPGQDRHAIDRAGGLVLGWHERVIAERERATRQNLRRLVRAKPFWRRKSAAVKR